MHQLERLKGWGLVSCGSSLLTRVWWLMLFVGWNLSCSTYLAPLCGLGLSHSMVAGFQEEPTSFLRSGPGNLHRVTSIVSHSLDSGGEDIHSNLWMGGVSKNFGYI